MRRSHLCRLMCFEIQVVQHVSLDVILRVQTIFFICSDRCLGAAPLDEILSKLASSNSVIQSSVDGSGYIRVTRTKTKAKMPATTEEYRRVIKVEMFAWLAMVARYKAKHWLSGLTAAPFLKFVEFILGDRVYGIQIPTADGGQQKIRPDWTIVLSYEQRLRKEAMKRVLEGHTLSDALTMVIKGR